METNILKMITIADLASLGNALSGLLAIFAVLMGYNILSAQLLLLAVIFDSIDGTLARKFNHNPMNAVFGENIDSLCDVVSFGVAPAVILYALNPSYYVLIPSILLVSCGILRLTRYNTIIIDQVGPTKTFIGLPIPVSSFMLAALLLSSVTNIYLIYILMSIIAILMVSEVKYPKIKDKRLLGVGGIIVVLCLIPSLNTSLHLIPSYLLMLIALIYIFGTIIFNYTGLGLFEKLNINQVKTNFSNSDNSSSKSKNNLFKR